VPDDNVDWSATDIDKDVTHGVGPIEVMMDFFPGSVIKSWSACTNNFLQYM
jgi:hypothetical protein